MPSPPETAVRALRRTAVAAAALAAALAAAPASAQQIATSQPPPARPAGAGFDFFGGPNAPPVRFSLGVVGGIGGLFDSAYNRAMRPWGYGTGWAAATVALETGLHLNRYVMLGARGGFLGASSEYESQRDHTNPGLTMWDAGALLRLSLPVSDHRREHVLVGLQFEGGMTTGTLSLRDQGVDSPWLPRLGVSAIINCWSDGFGASMRVSYQHANWPGAGGQGVDLGMDGLFFNLSLEGGV
jgi:hypothetical protein